MAYFKCCKFRAGSWVQEADVWLLLCLETRMVTNSLTVLDPALTRAVLDSNRAHGRQRYSSILYAAWAIYWRFRTWVLTLRYQSHEISVERCLLSAYRQTSPLNELRDLHVNMLCTLNVSTGFSFLFCHKIYFIKIIFVFTWYVLMYIKTYLNLSLGM